MAEKKGLSMDSPSRRSRESSIMDESVTVETDLFEHREVKPHFIDPGCFGEDFAAWLKQELTRIPDSGFDLSEIIQEGVLGRSRVQLPEASLSQGGSASTPTAPGTPPTDPGIR
jgi:hypothetical protein